MRCPNCSAPFRLAADYANHLRTCLPASLDPNVTAVLERRLTAAAQRPAPAHVRVRVHRAA